MRGKVPRQFVHLKFTCSGKSVKKINNEEIRVNISYIIKKKIFAFSNCFLGSGWKEFICPQKSSEVANHKSKFYLKNLPVLKCSTISRSRELHLQSIGMAIYLAIFKVF